jgi:hypothetical protein
MKPVSKFFFPALALFLLAVSAVGIAFARDAVLSGGGKASNEIEFTSVVESMDGSAWMIDGKAVVVTAGTKLKGAIQVGQLVKVHATKTADGSLVAREIKLAVGAGMGDDNGNDNGDDNANDNGQDDDNGNANDDDSGNANDDDSGNANGDDSGNENDDDDSGNENDDDNANDNGNANDDDDSDNANDDDSGNENDDDNANDNDDDDDGRDGDDSGKDSLKSMIIAFTKATTA